MAQSSSKQRPQQPPRGGSGLKPFYVILGLVAVVGLGIIAYQLVGKPTPTVTPVPVQIDPSQLSSVQGMAMGRADAPVVIYEFADYQCPACAQFSSFMGPLIKERLVQPGTVRYVFYDFPLPQHPYAFLAARGGRCANEQNRFWEFHDLVFARQPRWAAARGMGDATEQFVDLAAEVGMDRGAFESCLRSDRFREEVSRTLALGEAMGVEGTPTLFINGKRLSIPNTFAQLEEIVRQEAGLAAPAPAAGGAATP